MYSVPWPASLNVWFARGGFWIGGFRSAQTLKFWPCFIIREKSLEIQTGIHHVLDSILSSNFTHLSLKICTLFMIRCGKKQKSGTSPHSIYMSLLLGPEGGRVEDSTPVFFNFFLAAMWWYSISFLSNLLSLPYYRKLKKASWQRPYN